MAYSVKTGLWKSVKNTVIVLVPAFLAGGAAFATNVPANYQPVVAAIGGFVVYFIKNFIQNR